MAATFSPNPTPVVDTDDCTNLVAQAFKTLVTLQTKELSILAANRPNNITIVPDNEAQTHTVTVTFPGTISVNDTGAYVFTPTDYLAGLQIS